MRLSAKVLLAITSVAALLVVFVAFSTLCHTRSANQPGGSPADRKVSDIDRGNGPRKVLLSTDALARQMEASRHVPAPNPNHLYEADTAADGSDDEPPGSSPSYTNLEETGRNLEATLLSAESRPERASQERTKVEALLMEHIYEGTRVDDMRCSSDYCRARLFHDTVDSQSMFAHSARYREPWGQATSFALVTRENGQLLTNIYYAGKDQKLPVDRSLVE